MAYILEPNINDLSIFKNRIVSLMKEKSISSLRSLADKMVSTGLIHLKISSLEKKIQKHLQDGLIPNKLPDSLNAKDVQAYSVVFECSSDFILGNTFVRSPDPCIRNLCNRTGLKEEAISSFLKMTDTQFAYRTLRINVNDARDTINSLLTSKEITTLIRCINEISHEYQKIPFSPFDKLEKEIGFKRLKKAIEWDEVLDPIYEGRQPSETELHDVFLLREAMNNCYELQENNTKNRQLAKYQLFKSFQSIIDSLYPD